MKLCVRSLHCSGTDIPSTSSNCLPHSPHRRCTLQYRKRANQLDERHAVFAHERALRLGALPASAQTPFCSPNTTYGTSWQKCGTAALQTLHLPPASTAPGCTSSELPTHPHESRLQTPCPTLPQLDPSIRPRGPMSPAIPTTRARKHRLAARPPCSRTDGWHLPADTPGKQKCI